MEQGSFDADARHGPEEEATGDLAFEPNVVVFEAPCDAVKLGQVRALHWPASDRWSTTDESTARSQ